jgi:hypothetical protein
VLFAELGAVERFAGRKFSKARIEAAVAGVPDRHIVIEEMESI